MYPRRQSSASAAMLRVLVGVLTFAMAAIALGLGIYAVAIGGKAGVAGADGASGVDGVAGADGVAGVDGASGANGANGTQGADAMILVEYYTSTPAATPFISNGAWAKIGGTTTYSVQDAQFTHANNKLTYTNTTNLIAHGFSTFSFSTSSASENIQIAATKNGAVITASIVERKTGIQNDVGSSALHFMCTLALNDYIEIYARSLTWTNGDAATFHYMNTGMMLPTQAYVGTIP